MSGVKGFFMGLSHFIQGWRFPDWLTDILYEMQDVMVMVLTQIGREYLELIENKVIEVSGENISGPEKFDKVFDWAKGNLSLSHVTDSTIDLAIQYLVTKLKAKSRIS